MTLVSTELRGRTAVLLLDNPPVNTGTHAQRAALAGALADLPADLDGVVIGSAGPHFCAGSDLREFDRELADPQLPDVIATIEALAVPVVAAVTGLALGGGLELALGCDLRLADPRARFGFPEVSFGMLPGAGGTVRAPRLVGVPAAVDLVTSARQVPADEALALGLVDAVVAAETLLDEAVARVRALRRRRRTRDLPVDAVEVDLDATLPSRARPNVRRAAETVVRGAGIPFDQALAEERALFHELRRSEEAQNLRYLFFARQATAKDLRGPGTARRVESVGVIGAGTMGAALARTFAAKGLAVTVVDTNEDALARLPDGISRSPALKELAGADLVIEAVFEDMAVKQELLSAVEPLLPLRTVIASNTSYLDLDEMSAGLARPERFAGLHFFNPPDRNPLVEVIRTARTDDDTAATLAAVVATLGKTGIPAGVGDGFVGNRVYADYRAQAEFLVEDGASPQDVDTACRGLGLAVGPFAVADMSGLDIAWARRKRLAPTRDPRQRYVTIADALCGAGRLGRKTGAGWYRYSENAPRGEADPAVDVLIDEARAKAGVSARRVSGEEIRRRVLGSMIAAAAAVVASGVARRASDVDVALTEGFAFPRFLGGPIRALARRPTDEVVETLAAVYASCPVTFALLEPASDGALPTAVAALFDEVAPTVEGARS
ncbi:3-hydroxyacyl-CoA dehydrogenase NAD-binding domain-containing protein [Pseudonocardia kujensis]|uniref:3-hydroxyacyl-CoA dehydrogenase NAD-binding domain-containing protein n=1 Tax=Pseudonocardia kujensis TaxID=1128675 RepID=UPI001E3756A9|nr:3-hydroxyacyl-CoA dehydrogenase NAD-binding domain-containing protein [Pseudonocardia kujensis]MCE0761983.1 3-hydroxyacyl-CoA dehydrogenase NAD-binding domain-containing protein [Pseudonocardia kujensis]